MINVFIRSFNIFSHKLIVIMSVLLLAACTANKPYRPDTQICSQNKLEKLLVQCAENSLQHYTPAATNENEGEYYLGFVEFDDQGQLHKDDQLTALADQLTTLSEKNGVIVVVFVHGWKHNAHADPDNLDEDSNIARFREVLSTVSLMEKTKSPNPREVLGVYLGWRGLSITWPVIKEASFWERKNTAHKVGDGGVDEVLLTLETLVNATTGDDKQNLSSDRLKSRFAVIGHSFGGAVVYTAVAQLLSDRLAKLDCLTGKECIADGFGDLVILINPAFETLRFEPLRKFSDKVNEFSEQQLPVLAILTSESDNATKRAFPLGRIFSTFFEKERAEDDQEKKNRTAVGHYVPYHTHRLDPLESGGVSAESEPQLRAQLNTLNVFSQQWEDIADTRYEMPEVGVVLEKIGSTQRFNPYMSIYVNKDLIPNHNDIYDPRVTAFLRQLILLHIKDDLSM